MLTVHGETFDRGYSKLDALAKCHSVFWFWQKKNTVVTTGS
jgi:hypothetical protein